MKKIIMLTILTLIVIFAALWMARYSIYPTQGGLFTAYRLDRFTGKVTYISGSRERDMWPQSKNDLSFLPDKPPKGWGFVPEKPNTSESNE